MRQVEEQIIHHEGVLLVSHRHFEDHFCPADPWNIVDGYASSFHSFFARGIHRNDRRYGGDCRPRAQYPKLGETLLVDAGVGTMKGVGNNKNLGRTELFKGGHSRRIECDGGVDPQTPRWQNCDHHISRKRTATQ